MEDIEFNQQLVAYQREYVDFLDDEEDQGVYHGRVKEMIESQRRRVIVDINDLRKKKPERANSLISTSGQEIIAFHNALKEYVNTVDPSYEFDEFFIGFEGSFGNRHLTPRTVSSRFLNSIICVEGIVTQCSLVRPKLVRSVHYCPATQKMSERRYTDLTSLNPVLSAPAYPTKDNDGNFLETEYGLSTYKDHQTMILQEMPEKAPAGQLPRALNIICDHDLADKCKPGDRVQIVGLYRCLPSKQGGFTTGVFRTVLIANNITLLSKDTKLILSRTDIANCRRLAKRKNIFDLLSRSIAPTIHGHEYVKKAVLCMLLGGVEKKLKNGTRLRGDINILLIGDPSVAKSQILRYVLCSAPRAIATTGRGSSGVGLTAAVVVDHETGDKRLEAGAMVLADRGIVCIDEFDKMTDIDRTAIHEVMEQGRVTIAKAGIHAQLNARCSVLAAANPVYGKYDQYKPPMENIGLQDSLLSRFDLLFVMLDVINNDTDSKIADHVVRVHRYRSPDEQDGEVLPMGSSVDILTTKSSDVNSAEDGSSSMYEKYDPLLHGSSRSKTDRIFSVQFMRMYIHIAKTLKPVLSDGASELIAEEYSRLRSQDFLETGAARTQPVTVRTLETLIRLSTAHAKARLSCTVDVEDAEAAIALVQYAYFKKVLEKDRKRRRNSTTADYSENEGGVEESEVMNVQRKRKTRLEESAEPVSEDIELSETGLDSVSMETEDRQSQDPTTVSLPQISEERLMEFKRITAGLFQKQNVQSMKLDKLIELANSSGPSQSFTQSEIEAALNRMTDDNQIMLSDNIVFLI